mgnify:FL=1
MTASRRNRNNRNRGKNFERRVSKYLGFYRVPYSGSAEVFGLGDVRDNESQDESLTIGECKSITPRNKNSINYIIQEKWLIGDTGIVNQAKKSNKMPWLAFTKVRSALWFVILLPNHFRMFLRAIDILKHKGIIEDTMDINKLEEDIDSKWQKINGEEGDNER